MSRAVPRPAGVTWTGVRLLTPAGVGVLRKGEEASG
jgi:hypothetical protein